MLHYFVHFSENPQDSPLGNELLRSGIEYRLFGWKPSFKYNNRIQLIFMGWIPLIFKAIRAALSSLFELKPRPEAVIVGTHIEAFFFGLSSCLLPKRKRPSITWVGFIYTARSSLLVRQLRWIYFSAIFRMIDKVVCHSLLEKEMNGQIFKQSRNKFIHMPYGMYVTGEEQKQPSERLSGGSRIKIMAAGRSGRDYKSLVEAVRGEEFDVRIVCDYHAPLSGIDLPSNVRVLDHCYGDDYLHELASADIVVVPLAVDDISAGQMVMLQAMAYAKPVVVTDTPTIREYVTPGRDCVVYPKGDAAALKLEIRRVIQDSALRLTLAHGGKAAYQEKYSMASYVRNLCEIALH
ncbi:MAG: glycosyltransferase family 4 protein [Burkholderiaceae bacterium]|nr:glycosyltransferase family 4 protein [Burkholderiaceae bacterium]